MWAWAAPHTHIHITPHNLLHTHTFATHTRGVQMVNYMALGSHAGLSSVGLAPNGGSGVIWRCKVLDEIGGFRTESLGEEEWMYGLGFQG